MCGNTIAAGGYNAAINRAAIQMMLAACAARLAWRSMAMARVVKLVAHFTECNVKFVAVHETIWKLQHQLETTRTNQVPCDVSGDADENTIPHFLDPHCVALTKDMVHPGQHVKPPNWLWW